MRWSVTVSRWAAAAVMGAALAAASCGQDGVSTPTGPTSVGKAVVREQAVDPEGNGIPGATIVVDDEPAGVLTDEEGFFTVTLEPGPHVLEAWVEGETVWSMEVLVEEEDEEVLPPEDDEEAEYEDVPGIGRCVSECTHIYNPSKRDPLADDLFEGKFNASYCVDFCKETGYPGGYSPDDDGLCNPFYQGSDPDCGVSGEPVEEDETEDETVSAESGGPDKPGNGRGRPW